MIMLRCLLRRHIVQFADIEVVAEAGDGRTGVKLVLQHLPDVALVDVAMPMLNGIDAAKQIKESGVATRVLFVSCHTAADVVSLAIGAGGRGFVAKDCEPDQLERAIRAVADGAIYYSLCNGHATTSRQPGFTSGTPELSMREREVTQLLAEGLADKQVADELGLEITSARSIRSRIYEKLKIHNLAELTQYAIRERLIFVAHMQGDDATDIGFSQNSK